MSEKKEKTTAEVAKKDKKTEAPAKKANPFKGLGAKIKKFFKDFKGEWKKVTWPSGKTVLNNSLVVIVIVAIVGVALFVVDTGLSTIIDLLVGLAKEDTATTAEMISLFLLK